MVVTDQQAGREHTIVVEALKLIEEAYDEVFVAHSSSKKNSEMDEEHYK